MPVMLSLSLVRVAESGWLDVEGISGCCEINIMAKGDSGAVQGDDAAPSSLAMTCFGRKKNVCARASLAL